MSRSRCRPKTFVRSRKAHFEVLEDRTLLSGSTILPANGGQLNGHPVYSSDYWMRVGPREQITGTIDTNLVVGEGAAVGAMMKITASNPGSGDQFGSPVAVSGNVAIIGASWQDYGGMEDSGAAYVFRFDGSQWVEEQILHASSPTVYSHFGYSVSVSGNIAVVSEPSNSAKGSLAGAAYVFRFDGSQWAQEEILYASNPAAGDAFGVGIDIFENTIVVGAYQRYSGGNGFASVFERNGGNWDQAAELRASDGAGGDWFGHSVAVSGDTVVVGAPHDDHDGEVDSGAVYVFQKPHGGWSDMAETAKLSASDGTAGDALGSSLGVSGDIVVAGAPKNDHNGKGDSGAAYVFQKADGGWSDTTETTKLSASDGAAGDWFGRSVAVHDDSISVGAFWDDDLGEDSGSAYLYEHIGSEWTFADKLYAPDADAGDRFGQSVSIDEDWLMVGALLDDHDGVPDAGSVYVFNGLPVNAAIDIKPGSDPNSVNLNSSGVLALAILTTSVDDGDEANFDAITVDLTTLALKFDDGGGTSDAVSPVRTSFEDVDGDGDLDVVAHFSMREIRGEISPDAEAVDAILTGKTHDGVDFWGIDLLRIVPPKRKK